MDVDTGADAVRALIAEHRKADCVSNYNDRVLIEQRANGTLDVHRWADGVPISRVEVYESLDFAIRRLREQGWLDSEHQWRPWCFYPEEIISVHQPKTVSPARANPAYQKKTPEQAASDHAWALAMASNQQRREGSRSAAARAVSTDRTANIIGSVIAVIILVAIVVACAALSSNPPRDANGNTPVQAQMTKDTIKCDATATPIRVRIVP